MSNHAKKRALQPSGFKRTMNCPGWGVFCDTHNIPPSPSSIYAIEGSAAHYLGEKCLRQNKDADHLVGKNITLDERGKLVKVKCTVEMADAVQVYVDEIRRKRASLVGATFKIEERLDLGWLVPGMSGTGDHVAIEPLGTLYVDDYKHGQGAMVEVGDAVGDNPP